MADSDTFSSGDLQRRHWRGYTRDTDEAEAARLFTDRYGAPPEFIVESKGILLAGPIPAGGAQHCEASS